jgi:hypothetical protein
MTDTPPAGQTRFTPQPPPVEPPRPGVPTVDLLTDPQPGPKAPRTVPLWIVVAALFASLVGGVVTYVGADDSDTVSRQSDTIAELEDDVDQAQANAADARDDAADAQDRAGRAREEGYDSGYFDGNSDGYYHGYDQGWRDGVDPFEPYSPDDNITGVA